MQIYFWFCKTCICLKILENLHISVSMIDRLDIIDEYSVKCDLIFYDFIYLSKGFRMRQKVRSTLIDTRLVAPVTIRTAFVLYFFSSS